MPIIDMIYSKQLVIGLIVFFSSLGVGTKLKPPVVFRGKRDSIHHKLNSCIQKYGADFKMICRTSGRSRQSAAAAGHLVAWPALNH